MPTDADLLQSLRRGMPGSAMPSWGHLPENDLQALVLTIRGLAIEGKVAQIMAKNKSMTRQKALGLAHNVLDPGPAIEIPAEPPAAEVDLAHGKQLYLASCAACHGTDGRAKEKADLKDVSGYPTYARDFTKGIFKGNADGMELARRITGGMPGSPMPGQAMPAKDLWSLVHYIQTMIKPGAQERVLQSQKLLAANLVRTVPAEIDDPAWQSAPATFVPLMPLWWRDERIEGVTFRAMHDGKNLAIQLTWADATHNDLASKPQWFTDGAALQISPLTDPPFFGMGDKDAQVSIWHWKATWQRDLAGGYGSLADTYKNMPIRDAYPARPQEPVFWSGVGAGNPVSQREHPSSVETLASRGQGTLTSQAHAATIVKGQGRWKDGQWQVVFVRPLAAGEEGEISFVAGKETSIAVAVWDGEAGDRNGQKAVSIWHRLVLQAPGK